jgi:hypothetical protein
MKPILPHGVAIPASTSNPLADLAARFKAQNETRFPRLKEIKTHPILDYIPLMTHDEFDRLVWSIRKIGLVDDIVGDESGRILDGRCRFLACEIANVEPRLAPPKDAIVAYLFAKNIARRHLNEGQRAIITILMEQQLENDDGFLDFILAANFQRRHLTPNELRIADAMVEEPDYPEKLVIPEARLIVRHHDLAEQVCRGLSLGEAHRQATEREQEAAKRAEDQRRLGQLRGEAPFLAAQVDEGTLTLAEAVEEVHQEKVKGPLLAEHADAIRQAGKRVVDDLIEIGRRLTECKLLLGHGAFSPWLEREFGWSDDTALRYMQVYQLSISRNLRDFNLPISGLYLLAKPSTPDAVRDDVLERASAGQPLPVAKIRGLIDQARGLPSEQTRTDRLRDLAARMFEANPDDPLIAELHQLLISDGAVPTKAAP